MAVRILQLIDGTQHGVVQAHCYSPIPLPGLHGHVTRALVPGVVTYRKWIDGVRSKVTNILCYHRNRDVYMYKLASSLTLRTPVLTHTALAPPGHLTVS